MASNTNITNPNSHATAISNGVNRAYDSMHKGMNQVKEDFAEAAVKAATYVGTKLATARDSVETHADTAVRIMQTKGLTLLSTALPKAHAANFGVTNPKIASIVSKVTKYHAAVVNLGDKVATETGRQAYSITKAILLPLVAVFELLSFGKTGQAAVEAIALAVGFIARGAMFALTQVLGHLAPYVAVAAAITAVVFLAKVSPIGAAFLAVGLALAGQQFQIHLLRQEVAKIGKMLNEEYDRQLLEQDQEYTGEMGDAGTLSRNTVVTR